MTEQSAIDQMLSRLLSARLGFEFVHWPFEAHRLLEAMAVEDGTDVMTVLSRIRLGYTPERMTRLVDAATISHTMLFRHPEQFEYLAEVAAPRLLERNPGGLKVWSAGCATGEDFRQG